MVSLIGDLAVVGSGGAAMAAAITARRAGATVVLVERGILGGTCVNIGCVPSKTLLAAAGARHGAATHPFAGVPTSADAPVDLGALVAQKDDLLAGMRQAKHADVSNAYGFEVRPGEARFLDRDTMAGRVAALNALAASPAEAQARIDYTELPAVIFTEPQLASAGLTEAKALEQGYLCECRVLGFRDAPRALVDHDTRGALKLVAEVGSGRVLGVHAVAGGAGEIMLVSGTGSSSQPVNGREPMLEHR